MRPAPGMRSAAEPAWGRGAGGGARSAGGAAAGASGGAGRERRRRPRSWKAARVLSGRGGASGGPASGPATPSRGCPTAPGPGSTPCERQNSVVRCYRPTQGLWLPRSGEVRAPGRHGRSADQSRKDAAAFLSPAPSLGPCVRPTFEAGAGTPAFWANYVSCRWRPQHWS